MKQQELTETKKRKALKVCNVAKNVLKCISVTSILPPPQEFGEVRWEHISGRSSDGFQLRFSGGPKRFDPPPPPRKHHLCRDQHIQAPMPHPLNDRDSIFACQIYFRRFPRCGRHRRFDQLPRRGALRIILERPETSGRRFGEKHRPLRQSQPWRAPCSTSTVAVKLSTAAICCCRTTFLA